MYRLCEWVRFFIKLSISDSLPTDTIGLVAQAVYEPFLDLRSIYQTLVDSSNILIKQIVVFWKKTNLEMGPLGILKGPSNRICVLLRFTGSRQYKVTHFETPD